MTGLNGGTVTIKGVPGTTFSCLLNGSEQGTGTLDSIVVSGIQAGKCQKLSATTSQQEFFAQCGQSGADVDGDMSVAFLSESGTWSFGGVSALSPGQCKQSNLFPATGPFSQFKIFTTTVSYNNPNCSGLGNDGKANVRSCTGKALGFAPDCNNNIAIANGGLGIPILSTATSGGLDQINTFGVSCQRTPVNSTSCHTNTQGIIKATIDGTTTNTAQIDQNSIKCGNPDNPFFSPPQGVTTSGSDIIVNCFRCFNNTYVPGPDNTLVVTANQADGPTFSHIVGGLCSVTAVSGG
jgi:hypothetical protein